MPLLRSRSPLTLLALVAATLSCGTDLLGPRRPGVGHVALTPVFESVRLDGTGEVLSVGSIVPFTRVRVVLLRANGDTAVDRMVDFPADADSVSLTFPVTLSPTAPAEGEALGAVMKYLNSAGDTVFASAPVTVQARTTAAGPVAPVTIPITYVGPGSAAASLVISPDSIVGTRLQTLTFGAVVRDAQQAVLSNTPVAFTSTDTTVVKVGLTTGAATLVGSRGTALVIAQTLTGQKDTARITITPTPTAITIVSGNNQLVRQASPFAQPLRVRLTAFDGLGVANTFVDFAVTAGRGTVSAARVATDSGGVAQVTWTAGDTATVGSVVASVAVPALAATFSGTQLSSGPTSLVFGTQPTATIVAGDTIPSLKVVVLDATLDTVRTFAGSVTLTLTGGTAGASLLGPTTVNAAQGIARFVGLGVDRAGTGYRLAVRLSAVPAVATVSSDAFTVTPAPASVLELVQGDGQIGLGGAPLRDSLVVRARDRFGIPVANTALTFSVSGGGSVAPTTATTSAAGTATTRWTLGPSGAQTLTASAGANLSVSASAAIPTSIVALSGAGQEALFGTAFPDTIVFRVALANGAPAVGVPVTFSSTGGGSLTPSVDTVRSTGLVRVVWTAGTVPGVATLTARLGSAGPQTSVTGLQGSPSPTALAIMTPIPPLPAGDTLPSVRVEVRNGLAKPIATFTGKVKVALTGGTAGAQLLGTTVVSAAAGAATFPGLRIDRAGTGYRLVAALDSVTPVLSTTSDTFRVTPAAPASVTLVSGGGQVVPAGAQLPDPIVVVVKDRFGIPVPGATVTFTVVAGNGTITPSPVATDPDGRAMGFWVTGLAGPQTVRVAVDGVPTLDVSATALATNGPPILFLGKSSAQVGVGQRVPVTLFLSNPTPVPVTVTLSTRDTTRVMWSVPSITIPVGASQASVALVGLAATTAPVIGLASSSAGSDSLAVTVDSVHAGIALPHGGDLLVGDTLRTHVVLDRPAPAGGLVLQVQSSDSARVRIAPSDGTGFLDDGACILCVSVRDTAAAVTAPAGTATVTIPAGQLSAQIAVVALGASTNAPDVTVRVSGAQLAGTSVLVRPTPRKLPTLTCASGGTLPCELPVGHMLRLFGTLNTITRQPVVVRFRSLTPNLLGVRDSTATILLGDNALYTGEGTLIGKARGTGLVEVRANGFPVDTLHVPVTDSLTVRASWGYGAGWTGPRAVGTRWDEWVALGYEAALSASPTFVSGPPVLNATTVTVISRAPAVVSPIVSRREIPAGHSDVMMSFEAKSPGSAWVVMSAPGYRSDSVLYTVDGPAGMQLSAESAAPKLSSTVYLYRSSSNGFDARTQAVVYSLTVSDTSAVRVLTPTVVLPVGEWQAVGFVQARTAMPASPVTLTASAPGQPTLTTTLDIHTPALVLGPTPVDPWADSASYQVPVWPANGQAVVMPVADTVIATLRSSDPTVLLVTDSLVRMVPGTDSFPLAVIRPVGAGSAVLTASAPGFVAASSAPITVRAFQLAVAAPPNAVVGVGLRRRLRVIRRSPPGTPLPFTIARRGSGAVALLAASDTIAADSAFTDIVVRGVAPTGSDTLTLSAPGHQPVSLVLRGGPSALHLQAPSTLNVEEIVDVDGAPIGVCDSASTPQLGNATGCIRRTDALARFRLLSLTPTIVRVVDDTITISTEGSAASRRGRIRALRPGRAQLVAVSLDGLVGGSDTVTVDVAVPSLWVGAYELAMGMQHRTFEGELYVERERPDPVPLWVRLKSSAPQVAAVPDSVRIDAGATYATIPVTAGDTVGMALVAASAPGVEAATFRVSVSRAQVIAGPAGASTVGIATPLYVWSSGVLPGCACNSSSEPAVNDSSSFGFVRPTTQPIPVRLIISDTTLARLAQDTTTIPAGLMPAVVPGFTGLKVGAAPIRIEDRRASFPRLLPLDADFSIDPSRLAFRTMAQELSAGLGLIGLIGGIDDLVVETPSYAPNVPATLQSVGGRVTFHPASVTLAEPTDTTPWYGYGSSVELVGARLGVDTIVVSASGFGSDTAIVRVGRGYLATVGPSVPTTIRQGDSVQVRLGFRTPTGAPAALAGATTFSLILSNTIQARIGGAIVTSLVVPAGSREMTFWVRGVSPGAASLSVRGTDLIAFDAQGEVRSP